jgi:hypothetical protein
VSIITLHMQGLNGLDSDMRSDLHDIVNALSNSLPTVAAQTRTASTQSNGNVAAVKLGSSVMNTTTNKLTTAAYAEIKKYLDENHKGWQTQCAATPCKQQIKATGDMTWVCKEHHSSNKSSSDNNWVQQVLPTVSSAVPASTSSSNAAPLLVLNGATIRYSGYHMNMTPHSALHVIHLCIVRVIIRHMIMQPV